MQPHLHYKRFNFDLISPINSVPLQSVNIIFILSFSNIILTYSVVVYNNYFYCNIQLLQ